MSRYTAEANRLLSQLRTFINQLTVVQSHLYEAGEALDYNKVSYVTETLVGLESHMEGLLRDQEKHEPGHLWTELNRTRNQLVYQLEDIHQLFIKYVYLHLERVRMRPPKEDD